MKDEASQPARDRSEARITALLLGELDEHEAAEVRRAIDADPDLQRLRRELSRMVDALRETPEALAEPDDRSATPQRLSETKRQVVLKRIRVVAAESPKQPWWRGIQWNGPLGIAAVAALLVGGLALLLLPGGMWATSKALAFKNDVSQRTPLPTDSWAEPDPLLSGERPVIERYDAKAPAGGLSAQRDLALGDNFAFGANSAWARSRATAPSDAPAGRTRQEIFLPPPAEPEYESAGAALAHRGRDPLTRGATRPTTVVDFEQPAEENLGYALSTPTPDVSGDDGRAAGGRYAAYGRARTEGLAKIDSGTRLPVTPESVVLSWDATNLADGELAATEVAQIKRRSHEYGFESAEQRLAESTQASDQLGERVEALFAGKEAAPRTAGRRRVDGDEATSTTTRGYAAGQAGSFDYGLASGLQRPNVDQPRSAPVARYGGGMGGGGGGGGLGGGGFGGMGGFGEAPTEGVDAQGGVAPAPERAGRVEDLSLGRLVAGIEPQAASPTRNLAEGRVLEAAIRGRAREQAALSDPTRRQELSRKRSADLESEELVQGIIESKLGAIDAIAPAALPTISAFAAVAEPEAAQLRAKQPLSDRLETESQRGVVRERGRAKDLSTSSGLASADRSESANGVLLPELEARWEVLDEDLKQNALDNRTVTMDNSASLQPSARDFAYFSIPEADGGLEQEAESLNALGLIETPAAGSATALADANADGAGVANHAWGLQRESDSEPQVELMARYGLVPGGPQSAPETATAVESAPEEWGDYDRDGRTNLRLSKALRRLGDAAPSEGEARKRAEAVFENAGHGIALGDVPALGTLFARRPAAQSEKSLSEMEPMTSLVSELSELPTDDLMSLEGAPLGQTVARGEDRSEPAGEVRGNALANLVTDMDSYDRFAVQVEAAPPSRRLTRSGLVPQRIAAPAKAKGAELADKQIEAVVDSANKPAPAPAPVAAARASGRTRPAPVPQPELSARANPYSTFSLNVTDVSFKLAAANLEQGQMPEAATIRTEEFINAFDYHDPEPAAGKPISLDWERARYPFAHNREIIRFGVKTAAAGREATRPLNLVLLIDNSGSMERADRVSILQQAVRVLAQQLQPQDRISVIAFARTARLWVDGAAGGDPATLIERLRGLVPEGGTNLEDALRLAYETAARHYLPEGVNRVILLTDGAANLGNVAPESLKLTVEAQRRQGIALDCFGVGWEGYNDDLLETLSGSGDGRYGFLNSTTEAETEFADELAGALRVAAADVKVQVEFNPGRVLSYRQLGYAKHQLKKEQFRDNTVDAAEIGAAESGNALYTLELAPEGQGPIAYVRVRYRVPHTQVYEEHEWLVDYPGPAMRCEQASPALRLAVVAAAFAEWLANSPYAAEVTTDRLLGLLRGVPDSFPLDARPARLEAIIRQAGSITGR